MNVPEVSYTSSPSGLPPVSPMMSESRPNQTPVWGARFESAAAAWIHECRCTTVGSPLTNGMFLKRGGSTSSSKRASSPPHMPIHLVPQGSTTVAAGNVEFVKVVSGSQPGSAQVMPPRKLRHTPSRRRPTPSPAKQPYTDPLAHVIVRQLLPTGPGGTCRRNPGEPSSSRC